MQIHIMLKTDRKTPLIILCVRWGLFCGCLGDLDCRLCRMVERITRMIGLSWDGGDAAPWNVAAFDWLAGSTSGADCVKAAMLTQVGGIADVAGRWHAVGSLVDR